MADRYHSIAFMFCDISCINILPRKLEFRLYLYDFTKLNTFFQHIRVF